MEKGRSLRLMHECLTEALNTRDPENGLTFQELLIQGLVERGVSGDPRAFEVIRNTVESGKDSIDITVELKGGEPELAE